MWLSVDNKTLAIRNDPFEYTGLDKIGYHSKSSRYFHH